MKHIYSLLLLVCMIGITSCEKFLEVPLPNDQLTTETTFGSKATIDATLIGLYNSFCSSTNMIMLRSTWMMSDEGEMATAPSNDLGNLITANIIATNQWINGWSTFYAPIYRANVLLENLPSLKPNILTASQVKQYMAVAKYIRASCYFNLVKMWGDVPLVLSTKVDENATKPASTASEVYAQIVKDLQEASTDLLTTVNVNSTVIHNKYQADALLARALLYQGKWAEAETAATSVIASGKYQLLPEVNDVFRRGSKEAIFSAGEIGTSSTYLNRAVIGWVALPTSAAGATTGNANIPVSMLSSFEAGDKRIVEGKWASTLFTKKYPNKYWYSLTATAAACAANPQDYIFQRYAEMFLIRAEARAQLSNITGAAADLNVIRSRAGLANTKATDKTSMLSAVELERLYELFYEGHRWFDLVRTNRIDAVVGQLSYKKDNWKAFYKLWPIKPSELESNPNLKQNPGY